MELPTPARRRSKAATQRLAALTRRAYAAGEGVLPGQTDDVLGARTEPAPASALPAATGIPAASGPAAPARHARRRSAARPPRWAVSRRAGMTVLVVLLIIGLVLGLRAWAAGRQHASIIPVGASEQQTTGLDGTVGHSDDGLGADGHDADDGGAAPAVAAPDVPAAAPDPQATAPGTTDEPPVPSLRPRRATRCWCTSPAPSRPPAWSRCHPAHGSPMPSRPPAARTTTPISTPSTSPAR